MDIQAHSKDYSAFFYSHLRQRQWTLKLRFIKKKIEFTVIHKATSIESKAFIVQRFMQWLRISSSSEIVASFKCVFNLWLLSFYMWSSAPYPWGAPFANCCNSSLRHLIYTLMWYAYTSSFIIITKEKKNDILMIIVRSK